MIARSIMDARRAAFVIKGRRKNGGEYNVPASMAGRRQQEQD